jgi:ATP-dependent helicase HrpB
LVLELAAWGAEPGDLSWLDPPPDAAVAQARELLQELEALGDDGALSEHGRRMAALALHPRLAHMVLRGVERGVGTQACDLAALLEERDVLRAAGGAPESDLRYRLEAVGSGRSALPHGATVDKAAVGRVRQQAEQLRRRAGVGVGAPAVAEAGLLAALAYPDRIGQLRPGARGRFLLRNGRGATLDPGDPLAGEPWIVAVELDGRGRDGRIFQCAPVAQADVEELFGAQVRAEDEIAWDDGAGRVRARSVRRLGALVLQEGALAAPDHHRVVAALCEGVAQRGLHVLPWDKETEQLRARLGYLHALDNDVWPAVDDGTLLGSPGTWLAPFVGGLRSLDDLARVELGQALLSLVPWERREDLDRLAPTHLEVPSGSRIALDYSDPEAPVLAVRLQEVFGLVDTPRVGGGRTPLTLRLLSPAMRPVQVTRDLASFWAGTYFDVRKDLRARYPKHPWPEDPLAAEPTRRTRRRRDP